MVQKSSQELRDRAAYFRLRSLEGDDAHLKAALLQHADEFDLEATEIAAECKSAA